MSALPNYINMPTEVQERARKVLNRELGVTLEDTSADAVIEQVWNALVGHPLADECDCPIGRDGERREKQAQG